MKKGWSISLIVLAIVLILMAILPLVLRGSMEREIKEQVQNQLSARAEWTGLSASLFRGFPGLQVTLREVSLIGEDPFEGDTLAAIGNLELNVNPLAFLTGKIGIRSIRMDHPSFSLTVTKDGIANWDSGSSAFHLENRAGTGTSQQQGETEKVKVPDVAFFHSLRALEMVGGKLDYRDHRSDLTASIGEVEIGLERDLLKDSTDLGLELDFHTIDVSYGGIRYMRRGVLEIGMEAVGHGSERRYHIVRNNIELNGLLMEAVGTVELPEEGGLGMDLNFSTREGSLERLLSLVPAIYVDNLDSLKTGGEFQLEGEIHGILRDTVLPEASLNLSVTDGSFSYPGVPGEVSDIQIKAGLEYRGANSDETRWEIERLHMVTGEDPFDMRLMISHPVTDLKLEGEAVGRIDFATLGEIFPVEEINLDGTLASELRWNTRLSDLESENYERVALDGTFELKGFRTNLNRLGVPLDVSRMEVELSPRRVDLKSLVMHLGASDLQMKGQLTGLVPYLTGRSTLQGNMHLASGLLDTEELLPGKDRDTATDGQEAPQTEDSVSTAAGIKIPERIDVDLSLALGRIRLERFSARNVSGKVHLRGGAASFEGLTMGVLGGTADISGTLDTKGESTKADMEAKAWGVDIPVAYRSLVSMDRIAPMARYCSGKIDLRMTYSSLLQPDFTPRYSSIEAEGHIRTTDLKIYNQQAFLNMTNMVNNEKMRDMAPGEIEVDFTIEDSRVAVEPFGMQFDDSGITASGSHGFDRTLDYVVDLKIAKKDLGPGASGMLNSLTLLATAAGLKVPPSDFVKVKATITGTFEEPRIKTDLSGNLGSGNK